MPFIPHTDNDIRTMLEAIGAPDIDALFEEIPANLRAPGLPGVPPALNEMEIGRLMADFATRDGRPSSVPVRTSTTFLPRCGRS